MKIANTDIYIQSGQGEIAHPIFVRKRESKRQSNLSAASVLYQLPQISASAVKLSIANTAEITVFKCD